MENASQYKQWIARLNVLSVQSETLTSADSNMDKAACNEWYTKALESTGQFSCFRDKIAKALSAAEELHSDGDDDWPTANASPLRHEADKPKAGAEIRPLDNAGREEDKPLDNAPAPPSVAIGE